MRPRPDERTEREVVEPHLLGKLPTDGVLVGLSRVHSAAGSRPAAPSEGTRSARATRGRSRRRRVPAPRRGAALHSSREITKSPEPAEPLLPRDRGVRGRRRREDEEQRLARAPLLQAVLGSLAEHTLVGGLSDEADGAGPELCRDRLEPLAGAFEVGGAEVSRAAGRPARGIRQSRRPNSRSRPVLAAARGDEA